MTSLSYSYSIFSEPWWLDAVASSKWEEVLIQKGGSIVARLPYVIDKKRGKTLLGMPKLTQNLGPWIRPYPGKYTNQLSEEKELLTELITKLPKFDSFGQNFHYKITNWLPFYWQGFKQTTRYTYVIENLDDLNFVWDQFRENIKTDIRKAQKHVIVRDDASLDSFLELNRKVFVRQGKAFPYDRELVEKLDEACSSRNCRKIFLAEDSNKRPHAAVYIIWDNQSAYYLMGGSDPELRNSGANSLCLWEAIKFSSTITHKFDFEGSMVEPIERHFRSFGAKQLPYFYVTKINSRMMKIKQAIKSWL